MHEDDWRQCELVSARFAPEIAAELADIRRIHDEHRDGPGFTKLHVRKRIPMPLDGIRLAIRDLPQLGARHALALGSSAGPPLEVAGGFGWLIDTGMIYGREHDGLVVTLALSPGTGPAPLVAVARAHDLVLVSWCDAEQRRL